MSKLSRILRNLRDQYESGEPWAKYAEKYREIDSNPQPSPSSPLETIFYGHDGHYVSKWRHYFRVYEEEFGSIKRRDVKLLEIGVLKGARYRFGENFSVRRLSSSVSISILIVVI